MDAFVQVLLMACTWKEGHYVAWQSTETQYYMDVYVKRAVDLVSAMNTGPTWVKQSYRMPWTQVLYYVLFGTCGAEIILWTNDFPDETGLTLGIRYMHNPAKWHYANVQIPSMNALEMQSSYLRWGHTFETYASNHYSVTDFHSNELPYFYKPKTASIDDLVEWAVDDAITGGYGVLVPWILSVIAYYHNRRS